MEDFFHKKLIAGRLLGSANSGVGSFRHYLKQALRNYVIDLRRKRRPQIAFSLDEDPHREIVPETSVDVDAVFHREWVRALLARALTLVEAECKAKQQETHLEIFLARHMSDPDEVPSWAELGAKFSLDGKAAENRAQTAASHFRNAIRAILDEDGGDEELDTLLALL